NSGIYFRAGEKLDLDQFNRWPKGYEAQIFTGEYSPSGSKESNRTGSLYGLMPYEKIIKGADAGDWFTMEIIARGPRITIKVNGLTTVDEFYDTTYRRGHLALQQAGAGTIINFKTMEIKELPPDAAPLGATADSSSSGTATEWTQLFNGKDLAGWKTHPSQP